MDNSRTIRVLIIDDHAIVVQGLERVLAAEPRIEVTGAARTLSEGLLMLSNSTPDVILLDLRLPDSDGVDTVIAVRARCGLAKILVLTGYGTTDEALALAAGANAFLHKDQASDRINEQILNWFPERGAALTPGLQLTDREWEVGRMVAEGMSNAEVAGLLGLSEATVKTHLMRVFAKLNIRNRAELARRWGARGAR